MTPSTVYNRGAMRCNGLKDSSAPAVQKTTLRVEGDGMLQKSTVVGHDAWAGTYLPRGCSMYDTEPPLNPLTARVKR